MALAHAVRPANEGGAFIGAASGHMQVTCRRRDAQVVGAADRAERHGGESSPWPDMLSGKVPCSLDGRPERRWAAGDAAGSQDLKSKMLLHRRKVTVIVEQ